MVYDQFNKDIGERYSTTTAQVVPVSEALTIASLLEREAQRPLRHAHHLRHHLNRLFVGMNLQIDATLQYAKGSTSKTDWWPQVLPKDKYIKSAYNTYAHPGLPPGPISSPSVAAVLAALNPKKTDCLFYFHDSHGNFHCSATYAQHVALLKKYYGQGEIRGGNKEHTNWAGCASTRPKNLVMNGRRCVVHVVDDGAYDLEREPGSGCVRNETDQVLLHWRTSLWPMEVACGRIAESQSWAGCR